MRDCHSGPTIAQNNPVVPIYARPVPPLGIEVQPNPHQKPNAKVEPNPVLRIPAWALYNQHIDASVVLAENETGPVITNALSTTSEPIRITQNSLTLTNLKFNSLGEIEKYRSNVGKDTFLKFRFYVAHQIVFSRPFRLILDGENSREPGQSQSEGKKE
jgi:hypothetical protein